MACEPITGLGRDVIFEYVIQCLDVAPPAEDTGWTVFGAVRTKSVTNSANTIDTTADDSEGDYSESIIGTKTKEFSIDGIIRKSGPSAKGFAELYAHWNDSSATGGQPVMWVRMTDSTGVETAPVTMTAIDKSNPYDDVPTYSITLAVTSSPIGVTFVPAVFS